MSSLGVAGADAGVGVSAPVSGVRFSSAMYVARHHAWLKVTPLVCLTSVFPFLEWTQLVLVAVKPGLDFHKAAALGTALGILNKSRASLTGVVALVPDGFTDLAVKCSRSSISRQTTGHLQWTCLYLFGVTNLRFLSLRKSCHQLLITGLGPSGYWPRGIHTR